MRAIVNAVIVGLLLGLLGGGCRTKPVAAGPTFEPVTAENKELAAHAEALLAQTAEGPGREQLNRLRDAQGADWLKKLKGDKPAKLGELNWPLREVRQIIEVGEKSNGWPLPPLAKVPRAKAPPKIDGKLDDPAWATAWSSTGAYQFNQREANGPATTWKLCWDDRCLYVAFDCADSNLIALPRERDTDVWNDDCVELFVLPDFRFRTYWELIVTPSGSIFDAVQCKNYEAWGSSMNKGENLAGLQVGVNLKGTLNQPDDTDTGYSVEFAVPFAELPGYARGKPAAGQVLYFMLARLDRNGPKDFKFYAYQPLLSWGHNIWNHGKLELLP